MKNKNIEATSVVSAASTEIGQGLRRCDGRKRCWPSGEASIGNRWEASGVMTDDDRDSWEEGVRQRLEFLERVLEVPVVSRRRSKLVPVLAACERDFSGGSRTWGAWLGSVWVRETVITESSASSSAGEPDERLCIGSGRSRNNHPARRRDREVMSWGGSVR